MEYNSCFVAQLKVDAPNYLTELLLLNQLNYRKWDVPKYAFWRKEYKDKTPHLQSLSKNYPLELTAIRDLLCVFGPSVIIQVFQKWNLTTLRFLTKEVKAKLLYDLFMAQVKYVRSLDDIDMSKFEDLNTKFEGLPDYKGLRTNKKINL